VLMFGGVAATAGGMAFLPFALGGQISNGLVSGICIGLVGWILATVLVSSVLGRLAAGRQV
jgi:hypothetical protein